MQVSHSFRYLAVVGALIMASGQPTLADPVNRGHHVSTRAQVRHDINTRRQIASRVNRTVNRAIRNQVVRSRYGASVSPYYSAAPMGVVVGSDPSGRINDALARGLISPQEADSLTQQYYDSLAQDIGDGVFMANYDYVLNNLINLRAGSLGR